MAVESKTAACGQATAADGPAVEEPAKPMPGAGGGRRRPWHRPWPRAAGVVTVVVLAVVLVAVGGAVAVVAKGGEASASPPPPAAPNDDLGRAVDPKTDIGDPYVLTGRHLDYLYSSAFIPPDLSTPATDTGPHLPVRTFRVLGHWIRTTDAMPTLPAWAANWLWNPTVRYVDGRYVMWFTALSKTAPRLPTGTMPRCLGYATSQQPLGPFVAAATPAICTLTRFGAIDPQTLVTSSGQEWLYWKSDSNSVVTAHMPTEIWAQKLAGNGVTRVGSPVGLMSNTQAWEGTLVESPQMVVAHGRYYLFFSGNTSRANGNGIGVATCRGPAGPCSDDNVGPWLGGWAGARSVGEESLFSQDGATWLLYSPNQGQFPSESFLTLMVSRVAFGPNGPYVASFARLPSVPTAR